MIIIFLITIITLLNSSQNTKYKFNVTMVKKEFSVVCGFQQSKYKQLFIQLLKKNNNSNNSNNNNNNNNKLY